MNGRTAQVHFSQRERCFSLPLTIMRPKILLVDDDAAIRQMLGRVLTDEG